MLLSVFSACVSSAAAEPLAVYSRSSAGWPKDSVSLSLVDTDTFAVTSTVEMGVSTDHRDFFGFFSMDSSVLYSVVPESGKEQAQLIVLSADSGKELARLPLGELDEFALKGGLGFVQSTSDGQRLIVLRWWKRKWQLETYNTEDYRLVASMNLPRQLSSGALLSNGRFAASINATHHHPEFWLVDPRRGSLVESIEFDRGTDLRFEHKQGSSDLLIFATRRVVIEKPSNQLRNRDPVVGDVAYLHVVDTESGEKSERRLLGFEPTPIYESEENQADYFVTRRSLKAKGLTLWRVEPGTVAPVMETDLPFNPGFVWVGETNQRALVLCGNRAVVLDLTKKTIVQNVKMFRSAVSNFALVNSTATYAYLKRELSSTLDLLDLVNGLHVGSVSPGSTKKQVAYFAMATAAALTQIYVGSPLVLFPYPTAIDTHYLLDGDDQSLFVINPVTEDITIFDASTFEREEIIEVSKPLFMLRQPTGRAIWGFGADQIVLIDTFGKEVVTSYENGNFAGLDLAADRAYFADQNGLHFVELSTGNATGNVAGLNEVYLAVPASSTVSTKARSFRKRWID